MTPNWNITARYILGGKGEIKNLHAALGLFREENDI